MVAFDQAVAAVDLAPPAEDSALAVRDGMFATCLIAHDGADLTVSVTLQVRDGRMTMTGRAPSDAAVTLRVSWDDAVSFMAGAWAPTAALADGRAQISGDLSVLRATGIALQVLQPHLDGLRADTEYGDRAMTRQRGRE
jgi:hypothetical protein